MDLVVLPTLCGLVVFVCCFRPLVRRVGAHTNTWLLGWTFLLAHYCFLMFPGGSSYGGRLVDLLCTWTTELCGICFILAACNTRVARSNQIFAWEIGVPVLLQSLVCSLPLHSSAWRSIAALLLLGPAIHLLVSPRSRTRPFNHIAGALAVLALAEAFSAKADPDAFLNATHCALFLSAGYLIFAYAVRITRGVLLMGTGLTLWALSYPLQSTDWLHMDAHLIHAILDIPRYAVAAGMILSLLDEYFSRTESLALHDPLTGLPNRRLFDIRLDQAIRESQLTQTPIACLVIDVDKFKYINDTFGHPVGDGLLQALAKRLSWNLGPRDMLARTGGDEFTAILVEAADEYHVRFIAGAMMAAGCVPVSIQQHLIDVRISIGIAVAPQDAGDTSELHRVADEAMYRAKRRGGGGVAFAYEELGQIHAV